MKYFIDTEFQENGKTIELISIGIVCEDGRKFYAESSDYDLSKANEWLKENVVPKLWYIGKKTDSVSLVGDIEGGFLSNAEIAEKLTKFVKGPDVEFWGYYSDYDWVVTCWLFGLMINLPENWPMYCNDLKQHMVQNKIERKILPENDNDHNALDDAIWIKNSYGIVSEQINNSGSNLLFSTAAVFILGYFTIQAEESKDVFNSIGALLLLFCFWLFFKFKNIITNSLEGIFK